LLIDEAQDTNEKAAVCLHQAFMEGGPPAILQRYGDPNQAIYNFTGDRAPTHDLFPGGGEKLTVHASHRFGEGIANLSDPIAPAPYGLEGLGPARVRVVAPDEGQHTLFLFDETNASAVLPAYGDLLLQTFSRDDRQTGDFVAVGAVHRPAEEEKPEHHPRRVGHYWPAYLAEAVKRDPAPTSMVAHIEVGRAKAQSTGEAHDAVEVVSAGLLRLLDCAGMQGVRLNARRKYRHLLDLLDGHGDARRLATQLVQTVCVGGAVIDESCWSEWSSACDDLVRPLGLRIGPEARRFLAWEAHGSAGEQQSRGDAANIYHHVAGEGAVEIRLGSVHSVKGETHTATLVLETFWSTRNLADLLPWITGTKRGGATGKQRPARMRVHYVAMTRPTHLLCLAMRRDSVDEEAEEKLRQRGWRIVTL
jgi:hypothetical protein